MVVNDTILGSVENIIKAAGKYVTLNISGDALTTIPGNAFNNYKTLVGITMPNNVTKIGYQAFSGCENLTRVIIPSSVTRIGDETFDFVTNVTFQGSTISEFFGQQAFGHNGDLRDKYLAGGKGTYIITGRNEYAGPVWTKQ